MSQEPTHRQILVRCVVSNVDGNESIRYVEHSHYRLWQYLMANKHGIRVTEVNTCLWLPEAEWLAQPGLFAGSGAEENVNRLSLAIYEADSNFCNTVQRYVIARDTVLLRNRLLDRIPEPAKSRGDFAFESEIGRAVVRDEMADLTRVGKALLG